MTTSDTTTPTTAEASPPSRRHSRRLGETGRLIDGRIGGDRGLQKRYLSGKESRARAELAALRGAAAKDPGEVPEIWDLTRVPVPDYAGDAPTPEEIAVHTAMTLYAVHQQSRNEPVYLPGTGLGSAAQQVVGHDEENPSARARFNALVTSTTVTELRHHLRSFVTLLRARGVPLDHAMLADDIVRFQRPGGIKRVRLAWARQYYHLPSTKDDAVQASDTESTTTPAPEN